MKILLAEKKIILTRSSRMMTKKIFALARFSVLVWSLLISCYLSREILIPFRTLRTAEKLYSLDRSAFGRAVPELYIFCPLNSQLTTSLERLCQPQESRTGSRLRDLGTLTYALWQSAIVSLYMLDSIDLSVSPGIHQKAYLYISCARLSQPTLPRKPSLILLRE